MNGHPLHEWVEALNAQKAIYPENYIKLRCLENHNQPRVAGRCVDLRPLENWHAFLSFSEEETMLYAGEKFCGSHQPSLFDRDLVRWGDPDISALLARLTEIKARQLPQDGWLSAEAFDAQRAVVAVRGGRGDSVAGMP